FLTILLIFDYLTCRILPVSDVISFSEFLLCFLKELIVPLSGRLFLQHHIIMYPDRHIMSIDGICSSSNYLSPKILLSTLIFLYYPSYWFIYKPDIESSNASFRNVNF